MFPLLLSDPNDIFDAYECGLWVVLQPAPRQNMLSKVKAVIGGKRSKDSITVLVCTNMDGCEKVPLLVTGKSEKLRCFKHLKSMLCTYRRNSSAWITCVMFMELLTCLERQMAAKNQIILLF
jgi:hypothetical protein